MILHFVEFNEWKDRIEEEESTSFTKTTGPKGGQKPQHYQCNRGGVYNHSGTGKRRTKSQGIVATVILRS